MTRECESNYARKQLRADDTIVQEHAGLCSAGTPHRDHDTRQDQQHDPFEGRRRKPSIHDRVHPFSSTDRAKSQLVVISALGSLRALLKRGSFQPYTRRSPCERSSHATGVF